MVDINSKQTVANKKNFNSLTNFNSFYYRKIRILKTKTIKIRVNKN